MALQVAKRDASYGTLEKSLVANVPLKIQRGGQLRLVEHHDVRSLLTDKPV